MTPFQLHLGRKPRTAITNLIGHPECLLLQNDKGEIHFSSTGGIADLQYKRL